MNSQGRKHSLITLSFLIVVTGGLLNTSFFFTPSQRYNIFSFDIIIYLIFFSIAAKSIASNKIRTFNLKVVFVLIFYLTVQALLFSASEHVHWKEFFVAFKWVVLLIILLCCRQHSKPVVSLRNTKFILLAFLTKYIFDNLLYGIWRPGLFGENNFEQPLIFIFLIYLASKEGRLSNRFKFLGTTLLAIGGSKSTIIGVTAGSSLFVGTSRSKLLLMILAIPILVFLLFSLVINVLDFSNIDRVRFAIATFSELREHSNLQLLLGTWPLEPLSKETCGQLIFYKELITSIDQKLCFSRVLHGFIPRILHDHGLISLSIFPLIYYILRNAGANRKTCGFILAVIVANSLSVSGLNNIFIIFSLSVLIQGGFSRVK